FRRVLFRSAKCVFIALALADVAADTAVADESSGLVKRGHAGHRHVPLAPFRRRARKLEVAEREMGIERRAVLAPGFLVRLEIRNLPARLADLGTVRWSIDESIAKFLPSETMVLVALPIHVEGELDEHAKALLAHAQLVSDALPFGDILAGNQQHRPALQQDRTRRFPDRQHRAVLSDLSRLPLHALAEVLKTALRVPPHALPIGLVEEIQHRLPNQ